MTFIKLLIAGYIAVFLLAFVVIGNRADGMVVNGSYHEPYGFFNMEQKDPQACYRVVFGNAIWSAVGFTTAIAPIYFLGWYIFEPRPDEDCPYQTFER